MLRRLPNMRDVIPVYAVIASIVFGWSILALFWKLPSWMLFLNLGEMLSVFAYTFSVDLLESLLWLGVILIIAMLLPSTLLKEQFAVRGTIIILLLLSSLALFINRYGEWGQKLLNYSLLWIIVTILLCVLLVYVSSKSAFLTRAALWVADRLIVFLFLYIPLAVISLLAVLIRNIL